MIKSLLNYKLRMLDEIIAGNRFQVTSSDVNCGSGKTTLTVRATIGMLNNHDKIIVVSRPSRGLTPLLQQFKELVANFSASQARVNQFPEHSSQQASEVVIRSEVIVTSCINFIDVVQAIINENVVCKVFIIFDESSFISQHV